MTTTRSAILRITSLVTRKTRTFPVRVLANGWLEEAQVPAGRAVRMWSPTFPDTRGVELRDAGVTW